MLLAIEGSFYLYPQEAGTSHKEATPYNYSLEKKAYFFIHLLRRVTKTSVKGVRDEAKVSALHCVSKKKVRKVCT